jgi:hypothetical protein
MNATMVQILELIQFVNQLDSQALNHLMHATRVIIHDPFQLFWLMNRGQVIRLSLQGNKKLRVCRASLVAVI